MPVSNYIAVITGDIVGSGRLNNRDREQLPQKLKAIFKSFSREEARNFSVYRGDSFQGIVPRPEQALERALAIRATLLKSWEQFASYDCRMAIGIGTVSFLSKNLPESDGEAFRNSGPSLDAMGHEERLRILSPWEALNAEMQVACKLADVILKRWTPAQAGIILEALTGKTQLAIAASLQISQPAVSNSLKTSGWSAFEELIKRYAYLLNQYNQ